MAEILQGKKFSAKGGPASGWKCAFCKGTGIQPRSLYSKCIACRGRGEVTLEGPVIQCPLCKGTGKASNSSTLSCLHCKGIGVIEKAKIEKGLADTIGERLGEITKRLRWVRKETKPLAKEFKKETLWLKKLGNKIKKEWEFLWKG